MDIIVLLYVIGIIWIVIAYLVKSTIVTGICIIIALGMFIWANIERRNQAARKDAERRRISEEALARIPHTQHFLSTDYLSALLINEDTKKFYMVKREEDHPQFEIKEYTFNQILEAAIEEDEAILSLYPKEGLLGSTLPDSEESSVVYIVESDDEEDEEGEEETVEKLSLKMVVDDLGEPIVEYVFMENEDAIAKDSEEYEEAFKNCNEWYQKISVIIRRLERVPVRQWR
ncbi:hypothetical protein ACIQ2D_14535 [Lysinibacillus sp. NPDC097287]|uniref:hypothetical protein n=1 Tax=Lysinibacillus sp. NPDC097287 TaxID=3364144 RepID=UPI003815B9F3